MPKTIPTFAFNKLPSMYDGEDDEPDFYLEEEAVEKSNDEDFRPDPYLDYDPEYLLMRHFEWEREREEFERQSEECMLMFEKLNGRMQPPFDDFEDEDSRDLDDQDSWDSFDESDQAALVAWAEMG